MPKPEGVKWNDVDTWKRIVIAMLVVSPDVGSKGKLTQVAQHFGATYDTLDNGLREYKKQAKAIRDSEAPNKVIPGAVSRATHTVASGRVQKIKKETTTKPKKSAKEMAQSRTGGSALKLEEDLGILFE